MDSHLNLWQSLALAAIQGATEFLPVSSSGHLVLARQLFGWSDQGGLVFDTVLHGGSLAAILIYFWREWVAICRAYFLKLEIGKSVNPKSQIENSNGAYYRRLPWLVAAATIPVIIAGPVLKPLLESDEQVRNASMTGLSMLMTALLFFLAERRLAPGEKRINFLNALFIGGMQIIALLPGASRSGWTTAGGIFCGQQRAQAVRFAFFMAVPAIAGAIIFQTKDIIHSSQTGFDPFIVLAGFVVSLAVSLVAIHFCLKYFRSHSLRPFAVYLMAVGILTLLIS